MQSCTVELLNQDTLGTMSSLEGCPGSGVKLYTNTVLGVSDSGPVYHISGCYVKEFIRGCPHFLYTNVVLGLTCLP